MLWLLQNFRTKYFRCFIHGNSRKAFKMFWTQLNGVVIWGLPPLTTMMVWFHSWFLIFSPLNVHLSAELWNKQTSCFNETRLNGASWLKKEPFILKEYVNRKVTKILRIYIKVTWLNDLGRIYGKTYLVLWGRTLHTMRQWSYLFFLLFSHAAYCTGRLWFGAWLTVPVFKGRRLFDL